MTRETEVGHMTWKPEKQKVWRTWSIVQNDAELSRKIKRTNLDLAPVSSDSAVTEADTKLYRTEKICWSFLVSSARSAGLALPVIQPETNPVGLLKGSRENMPCGVGTPGLRFLVFYHTGILMTTSRSIIPSVSIGFNHKIPKRRQVTPLHIHIIKLVISFLSPPPPALSSVLKFLITHQIGVRIFLQKPFRNWKDILII